jgi:hypothetical protein
MIHHLLFCWVIANIDVILGQMTCKLKIKCIRVWFISGNKATAAKVKRIGNIVVGGFIKKGYQRCFLAKKPYLYPSLCMLVLENTMHLNSRGEHCHGSMVNVLWYALGVGISKNLKHKIAQMHDFGLSHAQIMQQHTKEVRDLAFANGTVTRDTFLLPSNVRNFCRKRAKELWMKNLFDPINVRVREHLNHVLFYQ